MKKRMLSTLLVLVLFLALVPTSAFASSITVTMTQRTTGEFADVEKAFVYYISPDYVTIDTTSTLNVEEVQQGRLQCLICNTIFNTLDPDWEQKWDAHVVANPDSLCGGHSQVVYYPFYKITLKNGEKIKLNVKNTSRISMYAVRESNYTFSELRGEKEYIPSQDSLIPFAYSSLIDNETLIMKQSYGSDSEDTNTNGTSFPDVPSNSEYATAIEYVSKLGVMVGDDQGKFNPDNIVNRAEMATIVCRVLGQTENLSKSNVFNDVPETHWANAYIGKASELGIVNGYGDGRFGPSDPVTCEQSVTMIIRAIGEGDKANSYGGYPDGYILVAQEKNLLEGILVAQGQGMSRGAVAMLLYNYYTTLNNPSSSEDSHTHNWSVRSIEEVGHWETNGTHQVKYTQCWCGAMFWETDPDFDAKWKEHRGDPLSPDSHWGSSSQGYLEMPNREFVIDTPAHEEVYCTICGVIQ